MPSRLSFYRQATKIDWKSILAALCCVTESGIEAGSHVTRQRMIESEKSAHSQKQQQRQTTARSDIGSRVCLAKIMFDKLCRQDGH